MATVITPAPTYADVVLVDPVTQKGKFNPIWLKWFLDLSENVNDTQGTVTHTAGALTANAIVLGAGGGDTVAMGSLGTTATLLHGNAAGAPTWAAVSLTADVTGTLPIANGGTGSTTQTWVTSVTASGNIASSGGLTPNITFTGVLPIANGGTASDGTVHSLASPWGDGTATGANVANEIFEFTSTGAHANRRSAFAAHHVAEGSTYASPDPTKIDLAAQFIAEKTSYLSSAVDGEVDGLYSIVRQGARGDAAGILIDVNKVTPYLSASSAMALETATRIINSSDVVQAEIHVILGWQGGHAGNANVGCMVRPDIGTMTHAYLVDLGGGSITNALTVRTGNSDTMSTGVVFNITGAGNISVCGTINGTTIPTSATLVTSGGALGTPSSGTLTNCTFPTLNQSTTGSAYSLQSRAGSGGSPTGNLVTFYWNGTNLIPYVDTTPLTTGTMSSAV